MAPSTCSAGCNLAASITTVCDDNGTGDPTDDTYSYTVTVTGGDGGSYDITGGDTRSGLSFGTAYTFGSFAISSGDLNLTITDSGSCGSISETAVAPNPCSGKTENCKSLVSSIKTTYDDNQTSTKDDDTYDIFMMITNESTLNEGCYNLENVSTGEIFSNLVYGVEYVYNDIPYNAYPNVELMVSDCKDGTCTSEYIVTPFVLPVELTSFEGIGIGCDIELEWETASETNNDYFLIEYSIDGKSFETIGLVEGNGTTSEVNNYSFKHSNVTQNLNHYRIKQVDFDRSFEYHKLISVITNCYEEEKGILSVYPNPTYHGKVRMKLFSDKETEANMVVLDVLGQVHGQKHLFINNGNNIIELDLANYKAGTYFIKIMFDNNKIQTIPLMKIE